PLAGGALRRSRLRHALEIELAPQRTGAAPVDRTVDDDPVQPRAERAAPVEAVEGAHGREERLLCDVLGCCGVADDEQRRAIGARPVGAKERLERLSGA